MNMFFMCKTILIIIFIIVSLYFSDAEESFLNKNNKVVKAISSFSFFSFFRSDLRCFYKVHRGKGLKLLELEFLCFSLLWQPQQKVWYLNLFSMGI